MLGLQSAMQKLFQLSFDQYTIELFLPSRVQVHASCIIVTWWIEFQPITAQTIFTLSARHSIWKLISYVPRLSVDKTNVTSDYTHLKTMEYWYFNLRNLCDLAISWNSIVWYDRDSIYITTIHVREKNERWSLTFWPKTNKIPYFCFYLAALF